MQEEKGQWSFIGWYKRFDKGSDRWVRRHSKVVIFLGGLLVTVGFFLRDYSAERIKARERTMEKMDDLMLAQHNAFANVERMRYIAKQLKKLRHDASSKPSLAEENKDEFDALNSLMTEYANAVDLGYKLSLQSPDLADFRKLQLEQLDKKDKTLTEMNELKNLLDKSDRIDQKEIAARIEILEERIRGTLVDQTFAGSLAILTVGVTGYGDSDKDYQLKIAAYSLMLMGFTVSFGAHHLTDKDYPELKI